VFGGSSGSGSGGGNAGLVQRSLQALFRSIALSQAEGAAGGSSSTTGSTGPDDVIRETTTRASFFEIFNERVYDLLSEEGALETALNVREDAARGVYVDGLQEFEVKDLEDAEAVIAQGAANRQVASTSMNRASSRSHAVFVLTVRSVFTNADGLSKVRTSRFTLVDLAGTSVTCACCMPREALEGHDLHVYRRLLVHICIGIIYIYIYMSRRLLVLNRTSLLIASNLRHTAVLQ